jgi:hypothetical protein
MLGAVALVCILGVPCRAENQLSLLVGGVWPRVLLSEAQGGAWTGSLQLAHVFDWRIGMGIGVDFQWNNYVKEVSGNGGYQIASQRRTFVYPIYGILIVDPIPQWMLHPALKGEIGYNSMSYIAGGADPSVSDYYFGLFARVSLEGHLDFSKHVGCLLGGEYQWARMRTGPRGEAPSYYKRKDMSGFGLRAGLQFFM